MRRVAIRFGLIAGAVLAAQAAAIIPLSTRGRLDFGTAEVLGYAAMVLAFLMIFFGVRSYREEVGGGSIHFGRAVAVGLLIAAVAGGVYVVVWELLYYFVVPDFVQVYQRHLLDQLAASGASDAAVSAKEAELARFAALYANPLINAAITFLEVFPVGAVVSLVSAAILRTRPGRKDGRTLAAERR